MALESSLNCTNAGHKRLVEEEEEEVMEGAENRGLD